MLSVTIVPGTTLQEGQTIVYTDLNLLGRPTIGFTGQVSTSQIEAAAVTADKLSLGSSAVTMFDILTKRPRFNPRAYTGATDGAKVQAAIAAAMAEGGGTITIDEDYELDTVQANNANMPVGYYFLLWAYTASRVQLAFEFVRQARLINSRTVESGAPVALLGLKGAFEDVVFEGGGFERTQQTRVNHATIGVMLMEGGVAVKRARIHGTHFRGLSNGIVGAAKGLGVKDCWFNYPVGHPNSGGVMEAVGVWCPTTFGTVESLEIEGCKLDGCEAGAVDAVNTVYGAYGLCDVKALGSTIRGNRAWNISGRGIWLREWPSGSANASVSVAREHVIQANRLTFDDLSGQTALTARTGINSGDSGLAISDNIIRNAHRGMWLSGGSSNWNPADDNATRLRGLSVVNNTIDLAANLAIDDAAAAPTVTNERFGIFAEYFRRVNVAENRVTFTGRTSALVTGKYWLCRGVSLSYVDDAGVNENKVYGPVETAASSADFIWLAGLQFEYSRRVNVGLNHLRNLNFGVMGAVDIGSGTIGPADVTMERQEMVDVVWPYGGMTRGGNGGTSTPATVDRRVRGPGYRMRNQRTSFLCDAATLGGGFAGGYVRVGSFLKGINHRVRIWTEETGREVTAVFEALYFNTGVAADGAIVQTGYLAQGTALITKARVCADASLLAQICHLDVYVTGLAATARVYVEVESVGFNSYEGLWSGPNLPASMPVSFQGASSIKEWEFQPGLGVADGKYNGGRITLGALQMWYETTTPAGRTKNGDPSTETDGTNFT